MIYAVTATAKTPLSFRSGRNNSDASTIDYIPGSALLGALVNAHHTMRPDNSAGLDGLLLADATQFGNLYPTDASTADSLPVYPFPRTAHSCKRFGGFYSDSQPDDQRHGMHDHLLPLALFKVNGQQRSALLREWRHCQFKDERAIECRELRSPQKQGYYCRGENAWYSFEVREMLRTHNGISRQRGAVQESILFSRSVLAPESCFWGTIAVDNDRAATLKKFVEEASQAGMIRVGSNRSRGMGRIELMLTEFDADTPPKLAERLNTFNQHLAQEAATHNISLEFPTYVPLTLTADAILIDHLLRYQTVLTAGYLAEEYGLAGGDLVYSNAASQRVMGWNSLFRLPKADELAMVKGSVFLFGFEAVIDDDFIEKLFKLQEAGIGLRRREGYGQLLVANPFHWEVNNV